MIVMAKPSESGGFRHHDHGRMPWVFKIMSGFAAVSIRIPGIDGAFLKIDEGSVDHDHGAEDADRVALRNDRDGFRQRSAYKTDPDHETAPIRRAVAFGRLCAQRGYSEPMSRFVRSRRTNVTFAPFGKRFPSSIVTLSRSDNGAKRASNVKIGAATSRSASWVRSHQDRECCGVGFRIGQVLTILFL